MSCHEYRNAESLVFIPSILQIHIKGTKKPGMESKRDYDQILST